MNTKKFYDEDCEKLAEKFLQQEPELNTEDSRAELATRIQEAVEDWFQGAR